MHHDLHQNEAVMSSLWTTIDDLNGYLHFSYLGQGDMVIDLSIIII